MSKFKRVFVDLRYAQAFLLHEDAISAFNDVLHGQGREDHGYFHVLSAQVHALHGLNDVISDVTMVVLLNELMEYFVRYLHCELQELEEEDYHEQELLELSK